MQLQLIRNATLRLNYAGQNILIDPDFAPKHQRNPLAAKSRNPMLDLPIPIEDIMADIDLVIVSHLHQDHFDSVAQETLPKNWQLLCQAEDVAKIAGFGFTKLIALKESMEWKGIRITKTIAEHGSGKWVDILAPVMGFILQAEGEPTVYWAGDTIWIDAVEEIIQQYQPNVIITHSCGAELEKNSPIVMDAAQTIQVCQAKPDATVIAVHMESLDHATVSRADLRTSADDANIPNSQLLIPDDGDILSITQ